MLGPDSRYRDNEDQVIDRENGEQAVYRQRRLLPLPSDHQIIQAVERGAEERLDLLSYRTVGSSRHFWQLCDANGVMNPREMTSEPRNVVLIPAPLFKVSR